MQIKSVLYAEMPGPLTDWFEKNARALPWRSKRPDPYAVWISEIMLQQTRIEAVRGYYARFLASLPDISSLANADEEFVLKLWEGLGYYSRARNLHAAAKIIQNDYHGVFPRTFDEVRALPGIGNYTAGAICSIAFGLPTPAVDGNVMRVMARLAGFEGDIRDNKIRKEVADGLHFVYPRGKESSFTQAIMELGEVVCLPKGAPDCIHCPLARFCAAKQTGKQEILPLPAKKKERPVEKRTILILRHGEKTALRKRPDKGLLAGLWEYPSVPGWKTEREVSTILGRLPVQKGPAGNHIFSHREWHMISWIADLPEELPEYFWFTPDDLPAIPSAFRIFRNC